MKRMEEIMKHRNFMLTIGVCAALLVAGSAAWAAKGGTPGKPPPGEEPPPPPTPVEDFYFWRLGHMDGPHDSSMALGISRDGKTAVGSTVVVDFDHAWRMDIDWAIATDDGVPPLYNELQVQEDIGVVAPSQYSAAYASSNMDYVPTYDRVNLVLDWGGSEPVGTITGGQDLSYGIEWLFPVLDLVDEGDWVQIQDFGGGANDMAAMDVTSDGLILVGYGNVTRGPVAFYADTTVLDAEGVPVANQLTITDAVTLQTLQWSRAEAVSESALATASGNLIIAGYGGTKTGNRAFVTEVLDAATDPITLSSVLLPNIDGGKFAEAYAMTPDGVYIVGRSDSPKGPQACLWFVDAITGAWVVKPLGGLSKKSLDSVATGVAYRLGAADGDLIAVGYSKSILYPSEAFVWSGNPILEENVMDVGIPGYLYDMEYILTKVGVGEASGMGSEWILNQATGIAVDDFGISRIVGWGTNPEGGIEAWLVSGFPFDELEPLFTHDE
jgi:uncharacterized membrane protein